MLLSADTAQRTRQRMRNAMNIDARYSRRHLDKLTAFRSLGFLAHDLGSLAAEALILHPVLTP
jgi:hypothetical protein